MERAVVAGAVAVIAWSVAVGISAPRWPRHWLDTDRGPLRLSRHETAARYRATRVPKHAHRLPEAGSWFGGVSKRRLPGGDVDVLTDYLVEVRRGEWVHWLSIAGIGILVVWALVWGPWWLPLVVGPFVVAFNLVFIVVLRHNRIRLLAVLERTR